MSEWKDYKLGDVLVIKNGKSRPKSDGNIPIYGGNGILGYSNEYNIEKETLIIGRVGAYCGAIYFENNQIWVSDNAFFAKPKKDDDIKYLYYHLKLENLNKYAEGSSHPLLTQGRLNNLDIKIPDLQTQTSIAEILSSLDDKIELNNKINHELESLSQTLFRQWFIDFEFPNEKGEPYKSSGGEMLESELGEIPKGWEVKRLDEISSEITRGYTTKYVEKSSIINLNQKVNRGVHLDKSNFKYYPNDTVVPENKFVRQKDILINSLGQGTLGRIHFYKENSTNVVIDQHITILRGNNEQFLPEILYLMLTFNSNQKRLEEMVTGSTGMLMLNINKIREFKVVVPPIEHQKLLNNNIVPSFEIINCNILENEQLISLRDTLLPKLITGELKVNEINN
ncbi:MAG: hypothetical protein RLZZ529_287 [Bacteroidota bacterium]|jgi:type I restriction enzyme S subunit